MKKSIIKIATFTVLAVSTLFTSCKGKENAKVESKPKYNLLMGNNKTSTFISPLVQIGLAKGYFDEYGLTIDQKPVDRSGAFEAVSVGKLDFLTFELVPHLSYGAQGADEIIFGGTLTGGMAVMANKDVANEVKDPKDLSTWKNKTIGVKLLSTSELVSKYVLKEYGYVVDKDVKYRFFAENEPLITATQKGQIDIAFVSQHYVETAKDQGLVYLYPEVDLQKDYICCRQVSNGTSFKKNQEAYKALLKGEIRSYKEYVTDEEGAVNTIATATKLEKEFVRKNYYSPETSQGSRYNPDPGYNGVLSDYEILLAWEYVPKGIELHEFYNIDLYATALKEVIQEFPEDNFYKEMWNYFLENNNKYPNFSYGRL